MTYFGELTRAMELLASQKRSVFIGQAINFPGTAMFKSLPAVAGTKIELPVIEDAQLGFATGLALVGHLPVCIYPRINFLLLATNQLVNHLDKLEEFGNGWKPKVIIRTAIAWDQPMDPGPQHLGDYSMALRLMCRNVHVERLDRASRVMPAYREALDRDGSSLLIERAELYEQE